MSFFLHILSMKGLSSWIHNGVSQKIWKGLKFGRGEIIVYHLLFTNNVVLFGETSRTCLMGMRLALDMFCAMSGQFINFTKCQFLCSRNDGGCIARFLREKWGVRNSLEAHHILVFLFWQGRINKGYSKIGFKRCLKEYLDGKIMLCRGHTKAW